MAGLEFSTFGGMDASDTAIYVADAYNGAFVFDFAGQFQGILGLGEVGYVVDVAVGPEGEVYIADAGMRLIGRFDAEGAALAAFGGFGTGDGEFSGDSPAALAVDSDGNVYFTTWGAYSAVKLDSQGHLLETIGVEATNDGVTGWPPGEFLFPVGIAASSDGRYFFIGDGFGEFAFLTAYRHP